MRIDEVEFTTIVREQIIAICNERKIYDWLFRRLLDGMPYKEGNVISFFKRGVEGWKKNKAFVFLLVTRFGEVAAAVDIKTPNIENAEIGYWASESHQGCMTNTVIVLLTIAKEAGYSSLYARVRKANSSSAGVLTRSGFSLDDSNEDDTYSFYRIALNKEKRGKVIGNE